MSRESEARAKSDLIRGLAEDALEIMATSGNDDPAATRAQLEQYFARRLRAWRPH